MNSGLEKEVPVAAKLETNLDKVVTEFFRYGRSLFGYDGVFVHADDVSCKKRGKKWVKYVIGKKKKMGTYVERPQNPFLLGFDENFMAAALKKGVKWHFTGCADVYVKK